MAWRTASKRSALKFILEALTIYTVPADLRHGGEFGRLVCVDGFEPHLVHASATSLSRSVFCFNFS